MYIYTLIRFVNSISSDVKFDTVKIYNGSEKGQSINLMSEVFLSKNV